MKNIDIKASWHKDSYEQFLNEQLPQLLAQRLPLASYCVESTGTYTCSIKIAVTSDSAQTAEVTYEDVPQPDDQGFFHIHGQNWLVVPRASGEDLDAAEILCVGDLLIEMLEVRLGEAPPNLPWDEALLRAWLPLDTWIKERFDRQTPEYSYDNHFQRVDPTNWLASRTHLRRLFIDLSDPDRVFRPSQLGRLCPYEKPEGPNMGRIATIAVGASIQDKKLVILDGSPTGTLGLGTSAIPLIEHTDANRLLMGANMMRQWLPYDRPEPALVQSGKEPATPEFWCGRNLLTAFISWGPDTAEDGLVLSESGARHLSNPDHEVEPGDKLSNRYGMKGVVSAIWPDTKMPKLADGTPVELIFSSLGIHSRLTIGQLREAVLGRLARAEGNAITSPPFQGIKETEIRRRLRAAGLPEDGMEHLLHGDTGLPLPRPSVAGWVYWGRTNHLVRDKLHVSSDNSRGLQRQSEMEFKMLHRIGAVETIREHFLTRAGIPGQKDGPQVDALAQQLKRAPVTTVAGPTPRFLALQKRLAAGGIAVKLENGTLKFALESPVKGAVHLTQPVPHPWLGEHPVESISNPEIPSDKIIRYTVAALRRERLLPGQAEIEILPEFEAIVRANEKLARLKSGGAPSTLRETAYAQLVEAVQNYFRVLLVPEDTHFDSRVLFSGRSVLAPGADLTHSQLGLADEMAWTLFGPQVVRELGTEDEVIKRSPRAERTLDAIMNRSWIIVNRVPTVRPTAMIAFRPVRIADKVVRIPTMACKALDADFDGDQCAVFLPVTEAGQAEAGQKLSLAGHLQRDPDVLTDLAPFRDPMWGLGLLSLEEKGRKQIVDVVGSDIDSTPGYVRRAALVKALRPQIESSGAEAVLNKLDRLTALGFDVLRETGYSLSPFARYGLERPSTPPLNRPDLWESYLQQRHEQMVSIGNYGGDWGHYVLASKCGALAANRLRLLSMVVLSRGVIQDIHGQSLVIERNFVEGLTPEQHFATVAGAQAGMRRIVREWDESSVDVMSDGQSTSFHVLARARRAPNPGIVFARAAASGEIDPLVDEESRLFVGTA